MKIEEFNKKIEALDSNEIVKVTFEGEEYYVYDTEEDNITIVPITAIHHGQDEIYASEADMILLENEDAFCTASEFLNAQPIKYHFVGTNGEYTIVEE